ncbi:alpha/beta fold hydrolase [Micromonospora sp. NPDC051141]|uniref:alpha/beta fold hydrolase n=1 Tax=Micromonospora sp. NPDC051141 TaxID=3364284 RepID=UPI0037A4A054
MKTMAIDGATVGWTDTGVGAATLLLHAGGFGAWFAPLAERLPGRVVRMLRAGYAGGPPVSEIIEVADHAAHAAAVLETLGAGPATVVGHSSGSVIALQLAHDRPDLVTRLVLSEPPLIDSLLDPADVGEVQATLGPAMGTALGAAARGDIPAASDAFNTAVLGPDYRSVLVDVLGEAGLTHAQGEAGFFFANEIPAMNRWTPVDLSRITVPVLLVQGAASPGPTHRLVARLAGALPAASTTTIAGANHLLPLTHPRELADAVTSWSRQTPTT